ncbi:MAG: GAF domain-containing protein [SAR202 cluster bacterium]|nr:GAF domain-containing protein [SAR202 cluster bacterium]
MAKSDFNLPLSNADCPNARAVRDGVAVVIGDSSKLKNPLPDYYSPLSLSLLNCPVQAGSKVVGVLGLSSRATNNFCSETIQLMTAITSTLGVLMEMPAFKKNEYWAMKKRPVSPSAGIYRRCHCIGRF